MPMELFYLPVEVGKFAIFHWHVGCDMWQVNIPSSCSGQSFCEGREE